MSGTQIGTVVGFVAGAFFGAPQLGAAIGGLIGGAIDPDVIKAPSIGDATKQTSQAGVPRPVVYGHPAPFAGNIIDGEGKARKIKVKTRQGKGGGPIVKSERFLLTTAVRICEGPIAGVARIWRNGEVVYDRRAEADIPAFSGGSLGDRFRYLAEVRAKSASFQKRVRIYLGTEDQLPDPALEAIHGVGNTPYYRGTAYMVIVDDDVTTSVGAAAQYQFEVIQVGAEEPIAEVLASGYDGPQPFWSGFMSGYGYMVHGRQIKGAGLWASDVASILKISGFSMTKAARFRLCAVYSPWDAVPSIPVTAADKALVDATTVWDSGWRANDQEAADAAATALGVSITVGMPADTIITLPAAAWGLLFVAEYYGFNYQSAAFTVQWPVKTGITATLAPELPYTLIGSDGILYTPSFVDPNELNSITAGSVTLRSVVEDIATRCNVPAGRLDATILAGDIIPGFLVAQQFTGADTLRTTQQAYFYDLPEVDGQIVAVKRGAPAAVSITDDDLLDIGEDDERVRAQAVEYPLKVTVVTQDPEAEYAAIPQTSGRTSPDFEGSSEVVIQLPIPLKSGPAAQIAHKIHKVLHSGVEGRVELALPERYSQYVPSDTFSYQSKRWLLEEARYSDGECRWRAVYDRASNYLSTASGQAAPPPELPNSGLRGPTILHVVNVPPLRDLDDRIGLYVAASGMLAGWDGCTLEGRVGSGEWTELADISGKSVVGTLITSLPNASTYVIDTANTVRVAVNDELDSITEAQLLGEGNACVIGGELCQFQTATEISAGVYDLSVLTRGRLDTATAEHPAGSRFVALNAPVFVDLPSPWIGQVIELRPVTNGTIPENNQSQTFLWQPAVTQTEWAPVQFVGTRDASDNVSIGWVGRGRLGTTAAPFHSGFFDGYRVSITKGAVTVVKPNTTARSYTYTAADQVADFGSASGTLTVKVEAMNRVTGPSAALTGTVA